MKLLFIKRKIKLQNNFGFYKSGIKNEEEWYGFELPYIDIRVIKKVRLKKLTVGMMGYEKIEFDKD